MNTSYLGYPVEIVRNFILNKYRSFKMFGTDGNECSFNGYDLPISHKMQYLDPEDKTVVLEPYASNETVDDKSKLAAIDDKYKTITEINNFSFQECSNLTSISFPGAASIGQYAFSNCNSLVKAEISSVEAFGVNVFQACQSLSSITCPNLTTIRSYSFANCKGLVSAEFNEATQLQEGAFNNCASLTSLICPKITTVGKSGVRSTKVTNLDFNEVTSIGEKAFQDCRQLHTLSCQNLRTISSKAFYNCQSLKVLDISGVDTPPYIENTDAFLGDQGRIPQQIEVYVKNQKMHDACWSNPAWQELIGLGIIFDFIFPDD